MIYNGSGNSEWFKYLTLVSLIVGGVTLAFWPKKLPKMTILRDKLKDFEKTTKDEAMK